MELKKYFYLMSECSTFFGKMAIFLYLMQLPLYYFFKVLNHKFKPKLFFNITIRNNDGIFFCGNNFISAWVASSIYKKELRNYFNITEGIFVDIGAHIGKYTILVGKKLNGSGKVIAIEPEKNNFKILKKNISLNKLNNIHAINVGCFSENKKTKLFIDREGTGAHSISNQISKKYEEIDVRKLDDVLSQLKIKKVDLIKIDVEGAEVNVLKGSLKTLKKSHPKIIFEALDKNTLSEIRSLLKKLNYRIKKINKTDYFDY